MRYPLDFSLQRYDSYNTEYLFDVIIIFSGRMHLTAIYIFSYYIMCSVQQLYIYIYIHTHTHTPNPPILYVQPLRKVYTIIGYNMYYICILYCRVKVKLKSCHPNTFSSPHPPPRLRVKCAELPNRLL